MTTIPIGQLVRQSGLPASTIRYYERIGLLPPSSLVNTRRRYQPVVLQRLAFIGLARHAGLTIAEIHTLLHDFPPDSSPAARWRQIAPAKMDELDALIHAIQEMKSILEQTLNCQCAALEDCAATPELSTCGST